MKKVLITTSGIGSRLGDLTKFTNKALLRVGEKPVISHIIDSYSNDISFVVTLGYFGDHVREYLDMAYRDRNFTFVDVKNYKGKGSSLIHSMRCAKDLLQEPFIYHASDTIVHYKEDIQQYRSNWIVGKRGLDSTNYASFNVSENEVLSIYDKAMLNSDFVYVGIAGIYDYETYWENVQKAILENHREVELSDIHVMQNVMKQGSCFGFIEVDNWFDTGSTKGLNDARKTYIDPHDILEKEDESIFFINSNVIKFFHNEEILDKRVQRAKDLKNVVPQIVESGKNFLKYSYVEGNTVSKNITQNLFIEMLNWLNHELWEDRNEIEAEKFKEVCSYFYKEKTKQRIDNFLKKNSIQDNETIINGVLIPSVSDLLLSLDFDYLSNGIQSRFHGDLILDNILVSENKFTLIDWRQDFGKSLLVGDRYYDFAKLNHSFYIDHEIIQKKLFTIETRASEIKVDILRRESRVDKTGIFYNFLKSSGYDIQRVNILTALIWLNMASLHQYPFNLFLFYFGKYKLCTSTDSSTKNF